MSKTRFPKLLTATSLVALFTCSSVWAQEAPAPAPDSAEEEVQEVVVTGSRVVRNGFAAPTPVNVLGKEEIKAEAPANIADFVNTLPSVKGSATASNSSGALSNGQAGISALNLRALGTGRTLVLFDGQRSVISSATGLVDTNTFPQSLIERVEVVTGGASSAYGSDAIGGVVNFILDKKYTGFKTTAEYGETAEGDAENWKLNATYGTGFADDRGHFLLSYEKAKQEGVHYTARDWAQKGYFSMRNPNTAAGQPFYIVSDGIGLSSLTPGGLITAGPLRGTYFGEGGSVNQLTYGASSGQWMLGGDWQYPTSGMIGTNSLVAGDDRDSLFTRLSYEVTPYLNVFAQASYAKYEGLSYYIQPTTTGVTIRSDNAYLPASVRTAMTNAGVTSFVMGTSNGDMPASGSTMERETQRYVVGADGNFDALGLGFKWDSYYQMGITDTVEALTDTYNNALLTLATDAVFRPGTTEIVCRSTLTNPTNGCVPLNRLGIGVADAAALDYVLGTPTRKQRFEQDVAAVNFSTSDIMGWAGPISLAFGAEWRREAMDGFVPPQYQSGWKYGNFKVSTGSYEVAEAYVEAVVPMFKGFDLNAAFRYADYSTSGAARPWKVGFTYAPIEDIKLRYTMSRDIRAPNLSELYDSGTARSNSVAINGTSVAFVQNLQGSTLVEPEVADGIGVGVVVRPRFWPGFEASVDYYDIEVEGVISFVTAQQVADYCNINGIQSYCNNMIYSGPTLQTINLYYDNLNRMLARGMDIEASYRFNLADVYSKASGSLSLRGMATHYITNITDDGVTAVDFAGSNSGSTPNWVYRITALYKLDPWTINLTARGVSDGVLSNAYTECTSGCPVSVAPYYTINDNTVDGAVYFDVAVNRVIEIGGVKAEAYLSIKNLMDKDPVLLSSPANLGAENTPAYLQTNRGLYDVMGRVYRVGLRMEF
ncbi:TonB-dependent receptor plug domain-containing protein [Asticcacaulis endophyticus]|uniref:TonB-dependent receptor plug domain-containing protein n=1 Tax=Asticcacaulis endophyticus TaxID=1395890 RepID=UPI00167818AF|nr:TonB-dependent receptor [Asticcacaulis endophyticus]